MPLRTKTYVCFDAEQDTRYYDLMKDWEANASFQYHFDNNNEINKLLGVESDETVKQLIKERLQNAKVLVIIIGKSTQNLYKYVRFEIEYAIKNFIPIIGVHIHGHEKLSELFLPIMKNQLTVYIPFGLKTLSETLTYWPKMFVDHKKNNITGPFHYGDNAYENLKKEYKPLYVA